MPIGYLVTVTLMAGLSFFALAPRRRPRALAALSFRLGLVVNELPFVAGAYLLLATLLMIGEGDADSAAAWIAVGLAALTVAALAIVVGRQLRAAPALEGALEDGLGRGWRNAIEPGLAARLRHRPPLARILLAPFPVRPRSVEVVRNLSYGEHGRRNRLDVYRHRSCPTTAPTLIHLHGGRFRGGGKSREARPLLYRLASQGWVCISANYRLLPATGFPDQLIDAKRVIAWVREHGADYGADTELIFAAGSSAGGHMASMAALTPNDPAFQPGFEDADTSLTAAISLYGYYGRRDAAPGAPPSSPQDYVHPGAPPIFLAHGDRDTVVFVEGARGFAERLRDASSNPVVYAELPGAQHSFDLFHSLRFEPVVDAVEAFAAWVRSTRTGELSRSSPRSTARETVR